MPILSGVKALVVHDHRDSVALLAAALEPFGVGVVSAASAAEARQVLSGDATWGYPARTGSSSFARSARIRRARDVPAIAVTFFSERFGVREARAPGFDVYLRKPIDPTDIAHVVATLVHRRQPR